MNSARQALADGNIGRVRQLLARHVPDIGQPDLRGWEWRYLARQSQGEERGRLQGHSSLVTGLSFLNDDLLLSAGGWIVA